MEIFAFYLLQDRPITVQIQHNFEVAYSGIMLRKTHKFYAWPILFLFKFILAYELYSSLSRILTTKFIL